MVMVVRRSEWGSIVKKNLRGKKKRFASSYFFLRFVSNNVPFFLRQAALDVRKRELKPVVNLQVVAQPQVALERVVRRKPDCRRRYDFEVVYRNAGKGRSEPARVPDAA